MQESPAPQAHGAPDGGEVAAAHVVADANDGSVQAISARKPTPGGTDAVNAVMEPGPLSAIDARAENRGGSMLRETSPSALLQSAPISAGA